MWINSSSMHTVFNLLKVLSICIKYTYINPKELSDASSLWIEKWRFIVKCILTLPLVTFQVLQYHHSREKQSCLPYFVQTFQRLLQEILDRRTNRKYRNVAFETSKGYSYHHHHPEAVQVPPLSEKEKFLQEKGKEEEETNNRRSKDKKQGRLREM